MTNHFDGPGYVPGHAEAQAESDRRAKIMATKAPQLSPEAIAIKKALGVPPVDRTDEKRQAKADKDRVAGALRDAAEIGGNYGSRSIDNVIARIGIDRFLAAAPPDVAAKMRAEIKEDRKRERLKAEREALRNPPKPKPAANIDGMSAYVIRRMGTQAQIDALNASEAAEHGAGCRCQSCEAVKRNATSKAASPAATLRRNVAPKPAPNATKPAMSQAQIDAMWRDAHERVARETGRR